MKAIAIMILCGLVMAACSDTETAEQAEVRAVFAEYQRALEARDADAALVTLDGSSLALFDDAAELATATEPAPASAPTTAGASATADANAPSLFVRLLARRASAARAINPNDATSGRALFRAAVTRGDLAPGMTRFGLDVIKLKDDTASAKLTLDGQALRTKVTFTRSDGRWRLSLAGIAKGINSALETYARQLEMTGDAWLDQVASLPAQSP